MPAQAGVKGRVSRRTVHTVANGTRTVAQATARDNTDHPWAEARGALTSGPRRGIHPE